MPVVAGDHETPVTWGAGNSNSSSVATGDDSTLVTFISGDEYTADTILEDINNTYIITIDGIYIEVGAGYASQEDIGTVIWVPA